MSVAPDLLLQIGPEIKARPTAAKTPAKSPEPARREASSFDQVYARERQAKAAEHKDGPTKTAHAGKQQGKDEPEKLAEAGEPSPEVAESGKSLPAEADAAAQSEDSPGDDQALVDPMLLLGLQPAVAETEDSATPQAAATDGALLEATDAATDVAVDPLSLLAPTQALVAEQDAQVAAAQDPARVAVLGSTLQAAQVATSGKPGEAGRDASKLQQALGDGEGAEVQPELAESDVPLGELQLAESDSQGALKDQQPAEARSESFASKLSLLSQAIAQQTTQLQRGVQVPGQPVAMHQGGWSEAVVDRVMWLSSQNLKSAEIQLDPAELGRLEVRINMTQDQTQVTFASPNAGVRDALEGQLHRLRDLFTQQGMNLLDVSVSDQSLQRGWQGQGGDGERRGGASAGQQGHGAETDVQLGALEVRGTSSKAGRGLVDYYA